jgi:integrase/recombinase XerD
MVSRALPRFLSPLEVAEMFKTAGGSPRDLAHQRESCGTSSHVKATRDSMLLKCLYYLGLRNSEVRSLEIGDIDAINRTVKVVQGKGKKDRYVPIPGEFADEMKEYIGGRSGRLFEGRGSEGELSDRHLRRIVKHYAQLANVRKYEEIHPHTLRHSYATHLQNSGVPLNVIQNMLGHSRLETTTIYTHMGIDRAREFIDNAFKIRYGEKSSND